MDANFAFGKKPLIINSQASMLIRRCVLPKPLSLTQQKVIKSVRLQRRPWITRLYLHLFSKVLPTDPFNTLWTYLIPISKGKAFDESSGDLQSDRTKFLIDYKSQTSVEKLTLGLPRNQSNNHLTANEFTIEVEVTEYMKYVQTLRTYDTPDYTYLRNLFLKGCQKIYIKSQEATVCDWVSWFNGSG